MFVFFINNCGKMDVFKFCEFFIDVLIYNFLVFVIDGVGLFYQRCKLFKIVVSGFYLGILYDVIFFLILKRILNIYIIFLNGLVLNFLMKFICEEKVFFFVYLLMFLIIFCIN